jgi:predicted GNAT family N-acyltransferase
MTYIEIGDWTHLQSAAQQVRTAVFVQEQGIAPEDEWDADDNTALHAVLFDVNGRPF